MDVHHTTDYNEKSSQGEMAKPDWKIPKLRKWVQGAGKMARRLGKGTSGHDQVRESEKLSQVHVEEIRGFLCIWIRKKKLRLYAVLSIIGAVIMSVH